MTSRWLAVILLGLILGGCLRSGPSQTPETFSPSPPPSLEVNSPADTPIVSPTLPIPPLPTATATPQTPNPVTAFPDPAGYQWQVIASGLDHPVGLVSLPNDERVLFVLEQAGRIRVIENGELNPQPFLDILGEIGSLGSEQGLLGLAFHPQFEQNGYFYVNYTDQNGDTHIARFTTDPGSKKNLLTVSQPYPNHNGGEVVFGPDGLLYLGLGDGGSGGDPQGNGQRLETMLGKILRLDVDQGDPYGIPADNPLIGTGYLPEIWAYGLRNPWRFSFDRQTKDLWIGDVGQDNWEEIDYLPAGSPGGVNFGWNYREGSHPYTGEPPAGLSLIDPVFEYDHSAGCSVTGGFVYRGAALPEWQGIYLFGDYCGGWVDGLLPDGDGAWQFQHLFDTGTAIASFGQDIQGEIYLVDHRGQILQLTRR